ncbi:MAG: hypothetical protein KJO23_08335 [Bacteroidia bacterium]|nr:hypothetical protein [Bacteroidia bacterium]NNM23619.1 hypothetical protein [Flavobacteriaceae bacterium]
MKKTLFLFVLAFAVTMVSCKNSEEKSEASENDPALTEQADPGSFPMYQGEFIFLEEGAVLKGSNFIYGVVIDAKARQLAAQVEPVKKDAFDMVAVVVRGEVSKNPDVKNPGEGWEELITIKEILAVSDKPAEADIKIEETAN